MGRIRTLRRKRARAPEHEEALLGPNAFKFNEPFKLVPLSPQAEKEKTPAKIAVIAISDEELKQREVEPESITTELSGPELPGIKEQVQQVDLELRFTEEDGKKGVTFPKFVVYNGQKAEVLNIKADGYSKQNTPTVTVGITHIAKDDYGSIGVHGFSYDSFILDEPILYDVHAGYVNSTREMFAAFGVPRIHGDTNYWLTPGNYETTSTDGQLHGEKIITLSNAWKKAESFDEKCAVLALLCKENTEFYAKWENRRISVIEKQARESKKYLELREKLLEDGMLSPKEEAAKDMIERSLLKYSEAAEMASMFFGAKAQKQVIEREQGQRVDEYVFFNGYANFVRARMDEYTQAFAEIAKEINTPGATAFENAALTRELEKAVKTARKEREAVEAAANRMANIKVNKVRVRPKGTDPKIVLEAKKQEAIALGNALMNSMVEADKAVLDLLRKTGPHGVNKENALKALEAVELKVNERLLSGNVLVEGHPYAPKAYKEMCNDLKHEGIPARAISANRSEPKKSSPITRMTTAFQKENPESSFWRTAGFVLNGENGREEKSREFREEFEKGFSEGFRKRVANNVLLMDGFEFIFDRRYDTGESGHDLYNAVIKLGEQMGQLSIGECREIFDVTRGITGEGAKSRKLSYIIEYIHGRDSGRITQEDISRYFTSVAKVDDAVERIEEGSVPDGYVEVPNLLMEKLQMGAYLSDINEKILLSEDKVFVSLNALEELEKFCVSVVLKSNATGNNEDRKMGLGFILGAWRMENNEENQSILEKEITLKFLRGYSELFGIGDYAERELKKTGSWMGDELAKRSADAPSPGKKASLSRINKAFERALADARESALENNLEKALESIYSSERPDYVKHYLEYGNGPVENPEEALSMVLFRAVKEPVKDPKRKLKKEKMLELRQKALSDNVFRSALEKAVVVNVIRETAKEYDEVFTGILVGGIVLAYGDLEFWDGGKKVAASELLTGDPFELRKRINECKRTFEYTPTIIANHDKEQGLEGLKEKWRKCLTESVAASSSKEEALKQAYNALTEPADNKRKKKRKTDDVDKFFNNVVDWTTKRIKRKEDKQEPKQEEEPITRHLPEPAQEEKEEPEETSLPEPEEEPAQEEPVEKEEAPEPEAEEPQEKPEKPEEKEKQEQLEEKAHKDVAWETEEELFQVIEAELFLPFVQASDEKDFNFLVRDFSLKKELDASAALEPSIAELKDSMKRENLWAKLKKSNIRQVEQAFKGWYKKHHQPVKGPGK